MYVLKENRMNKFTSIAVAAAAASIAVTGCSVFRGQSTPGEYVDDVAITAQVKTDLLDSKRVDGLDVNVDSTNGKVVLTGWASSSAEAQTAASIARNTKGVKSVDNRLKVKE
jgi:hyperosmotically inducible periplasmic protein